VYEKRVRLGAVSGGLYGLGGWTLTPNHYYSAQGRTLYEGSGTVRKADPVGTPACVFGSASPGTGEVQVVSRDGSEVYVFNSAGWHMRTLDTYFGVINYSFSYDTNGYLLVVTDKDGNQTEVERDAQGSPVAVVSPDGLRTVLGLDGEGLLGQVVNPEGETNRFEYTALGLLTNVITRRGYEYRMSYDPTGAVVRAEHPSGGWETWSRSYSYNKIGINAVGLMSRTTHIETTYENDGSRVRRHTSPAGAVWETISNYDGTEVTNRLPNGTEIRVRSGPDPQFGLQVPRVESYRVQMPSGLGKTVTVQRTVSLADTNVLSLVAMTNTVEVNGRTNEMVYTAADRKMQVQTAGGRSYAVWYNAKGRAEKMEVPGLYALEATYDSRGRFQGVYQGTGAVRRALWVGYGADGYPERITNGLNQVSVLQADKVGRVTNGVRPDGQSVALAYDASGNVVGVTPPGRTPHTMDYTSVGALDRYGAPNVGQETNQLFTWNPARQLTSVKYPDGRTITNEYAQSGLLMSSAWPENRVTYTYACNCGQVGSVESTNGGVTVAFGYDGSLLTNAAWSGPVTGRVGYAYDGELRLAGILVNGSATAEYAYDEDGLVIQAGELGMQRDVQNGLLTNTVLGGVTDGRAFDGFMQLGSYGSAYEGSNLLSLGYGYDQLGRITSRVERVLNTTNIYGYAYDAAGRLVEVRTNGSVRAVYGYDANGNRTNAVVAGVGSTGSYDGQDRMTSYGSAVYQYTAGGTLTNKTQSGQTTSYRYDTRGNLLKVTLPGGTAVEYVIDGLGRRIGRKVNGALNRGYLYMNGLKPVAEVDGSMGVVNYFVYGTQGQTPDYLVRSGTTYRVLSDHLGSVRLVVNTESGAIVQRMDYDEWGNVVQDTNPGFQPFGYAGGLYDPDTKLVRFGYRDYDALTGRWTAKDPILFGGGDPNLNAYVGNDPINWIDPFGLIVVNNEDWPIFVKPESGSEEIGILPPGHTWPGSPDGIKFPGKPWQKVRGKPWLPDNDVEMNPGGIVECIGGPCVLPGLGPKPFPSPPSDWDIPDNPDILPGVFPNPK